MGQGLDVLAVKRVNTIMAELRDQRDIPQRLRFLERINEVETTEGEIRGRFKGNVYISDILFEGAVAVVKGGQKYTTFTSAIPKFKHGIHIPEEMVSLLLRLEKGAGIGFDELTLRGYVANREADILLGIRERKNAVVIAMLLDDFNYSNGGVVISGAGWGVPAAFKTTVNPWYTAATGAPITSATPISDISTQRQASMEIYGEARNRLTLSSVALRGILGTDEFKAKAQLYSMLSFPTGSFPLLADLGPQLSLLKTILDDGTGPMVIEVDDSRYWDLTDSGAEVSTRFWPQNKVMLSNSADDNDNRAAYFGKVVVPETAVSSLVDVGGVIGRFESESFGPVSWAEAPSLNPPDVNIWGADKGWPVRNRLGMVDILTVATAP